MAYGKHPASYAKHPGSVSQHYGSVGKHPATYSNHPASSGAVAPATPTLTAPTNGTTIYPGQQITVSATTTDTNLDKMEWVLDGSTVVATVVGSGTPAGTFSTTWTPTGLSIGSHTLVAKATRGGLSTSSSAATLTYSSNFTAFAQSLGLTVLAGWQSDLGVTLGTGVSALTDQSGNGNTLSQGTGSAQPTYSSSDATLNNMPSMTFDGSNDVLSSTLNLPAPSITIYSVAKQVTWVAAHELWSAGTADNYALSPNTASPQVLMYNGVISSRSSGGTVGSWFRCIQSFTNSTSDSLKVGSAAAVTGTNTGNADPAAGYNWGKNTGGASFANMAMAMQIILSGTLSGANQTALDNMGTALYGAGVLV